MERPHGVVTFLLTDVVGSTRTWDTDDRQRVQQAIERMYDLVHEAVSAAGGFLPAEQGEGDSVVAAFRSPSHALLAASHAQVALAGEAWPTSSPVQLRMAIHTGEAILRAEQDYLGPVIIRTARLRALAHGGQVLVSSVSRQLAGADLPPGIGLADLGVHALRDLSEPEHVYQLTYPGLTTKFPPLVTRPALRGDVPLELTALVGRDAEVAAVDDLLARSRLVTLTGPGGSGKTRLAISAASEVAARLSGGAWFVDLASLADPELVDTSVATSLGIVLGTTSTRAAIADRLGDEPVLLVLDNGEHLVEAVADLAVDLLRACPNLAVLATSRVVLDVPGEVAWQLPPLGLPAEDTDLTDVAALATSPAVQLFVARAAEARHGFELHAGNAAAVVAVVRRLDGLPLGIELAAARVRSLPPERIAIGLDDALAFLSSRSSRRLSRQRKPRGVDRLELRPARRARAARAAATVGVRRLDTARRRRSRRHR